MVKAGHVDFGIASWTRADPEIEIAPLITDRLGVVFPPNHPLQAKKRIRLQDLTRVPLILSNHETSTRLLIDKAFESIRHVVVPAYEANVAFTIIGLVKAGLGAALLPSSIAFEGGPPTGLGIRTIRHPGLVRRVGIIRKARRSLSPAADEFFAVMRDVCKTHRV